MKIKKAIFPAGGLGTRFLPATKVIPKEMLPVFNKPMIQYAIEEAKKAGIEEFLFITSRGKTSIEDHFDVSFELEHKLLTHNKEDYYSMVADSVPNIGTTFFIRQQQTLGLGHAILCAKNFINNEPFIVILPDELIIDKNNSKSFYLEEMINLFNEKKGRSMIMATTKVDDSSLSSYGVFEVNHIDKNIIKANSIIEKPSIEKAPSNYVSIGRYVLPPEIIFELEKAKPTLNNEIQLTDSIDNLLKHTDIDLYAYIIDADRFDCGSPLGLIQAGLAMGLKCSKHKEQVKKLIRNLLDVV